MKSSLKENLGQRGGLATRAPDPTPLQIRIMCRRIRRRWLPEEFHLRKRYYQ
jgi:hypothetical protein